MRRAKTGAASGAANGPAVGAGLTAADVSRLWGTPIGSVYRLAKEQQWRRYRRQGRTYYSADDVQVCFSRRLARQV
ncbi:hypothetical protein FE633_04905 [Streptomyces montanus]|uniref:Helix-turn-helix domain-containing protein n=1 Tax=Streptomyces montanus TaxID=2580423 RepID=A0A5R9FXJ7_9ACTN|nr:hypothetical protein FE633_04905 [Streptomyces montanus]